METIDDPCGKTKLMIGYKDGQRGFVIMDTSPTKYENKYHILRSVNNSDFVEVATLAREHTFGGFFTIFTDSSVSSTGTYRYKVVTELSFANGKTLSGETEVIGLINGAISDNAIVITVKDGRIQILNNNPKKNSKSPAPTMRRPKASR